MATVRKTKKARTAEVIDEYKQLVLARYPDAEFEVSRGDDPPGIYVWATVNVDDLWEVIDYVTPKVLEVQIDEGLSIYLIPTQERPLRARLAEAAERGRAAQAGARAAGSDG